MDLATSLIKDAMAPSTRQNEAGQEQHSHVSPETLVEENIPGAFPDVATPALESEKKNEWTTEEVRPRHLGNEGKAPGTGVGAGAEELPSPLAKGLTSNARDPAAGEADRLSSRENLGQFSGAGYAGAQEEHHPHHRAIDEVHGGARAPLAGEDPVLEAAGERQTPAVDSPLGSGGVRNGVLGAGSDDPRGESSQSPHERQSRYARSDVRSSIPSVRESGLGQGGVHNGVVGHGSHEEEDDHRRRRESGGEAGGAGAGVTDTL